MHFIRCLITLFLGLTPAYVYADEQGVKLITELSPFTRISSIDHSGGEATQFTQRVLEEAGIAHELLYLPWRRAYNNVSIEPNVLIFPLARTAQRETNFQWVGQLIPVNYYLIRLKTRQDISVNTLADARQYRIGVVNYHVHHEYLLSQGFTALQPVNSNTQNLKKALLGRIDLFPISDGGLVPICERESLDCSRFEPIFKLEEISGGLYMAYSLATPATIVESTRRGYHQLVENGVHAKIFQSRLDYIDQFNAFWPIAAEPETEPQR